MPPNRPSIYPQWATDPAAEIVEPSFGKRALGWVKEKPPFQFFNWFFNLVYQWIVWLAEAPRDGSPNGLAKIEIDSEVRAGDHGSFELVKDERSLLEVRLNYIPEDPAPGEIGLTIWTANVLRATSLLHVGAALDERVEIGSNGGTSADARLLRVRGVGGLPTVLDARGYLTGTGENPSLDLESYGPPDRTLYSENLVKYRAQIVFSAPSGTLQGVVAGRTHNSSLTLGLDGNRFRVDILTGGLVEATIDSVHRDEGFGDLRTYRVESYVTLDGGQHFVSFVVYYWDNVGQMWEPMLPGSTVPSSTRYTVKIIGL